jgi:hypothetical protein
MLRYSLVLALGLVWAGSASASNWADSLFEELSRDFGSVPRGPTLNHPFRVVNKTNSTIHISNVRVSCGRCSSAHALQTELAPGQETAIVVTMDTRQFSGTKKIDVFVQFDKPHFDEVRLWVHANSRDDVSVLPESLAFGKIKRGTAASTTATVTFLGNQNWQITASSCESNYVQTACELVRRDTNEVIYKLTATMRTDAPAGKWFTDVWLQTNNPGSPKIRVPLTVEIEAALTVSPALVNLGDIKVGKLAERKVIVRGVRPFQLTGLQGVDKLLSIKDSTSDSKSVHVLTVTVQPLQVGELVRTVRVMTDLKGEDPVEFTVVAQAVP